jgi:hypothetical protein
MNQASPVLYPNDLGEGDEPTLVWRQRILRIPRRNGAETPFPFAPVLELCIDGRLSGQRAVRDGVVRRQEGIVPAAAEVLDVDRQCVYRWLKSGLTVDQADVIAIMFGLHPSLIWLDWFAHAPDESNELDVFAEAPGSSYVATASGHAESQLAPDLPMVCIRDLDLRIERLRELGLSWNAIERDLGENGYTNWRSGRPWRATQLAKMFGGELVSA